MPGNRQQEHGTVIRNKRLSPPICLRCTMMLQVPILSPIALTSVCTGDTLEMVISSSFCPLFLLPGIVQGPIQLVKHEMPLNHAIFLAVLDISRTFLFLVSIIPKGNCQNAEHRIAYWTFIETITLIL